MGVITVTMFTADVLGHAKGLGWVYDVIQPMMDQKDIAMYELKVVRYLTVLAGCIGIITSSWLTISWV